MTDTTTATYGMTMLVCADVARSRDFYRSTFGLTVVDDYPPGWVALQLGAGIQLGLHPADTDLPVHPGSAFIGFAVPDVDAFVAAAVGHGVRVIKPASDENFGRLAVIADPDGYPVQVYALKH